MKLSTSTYILLVCMTTWSCNEKIPIAVQHVINNSKHKGIELKTTIEHYKQPKDSLKLKAAYFLIENMLPHYGVEGKILQNYKNVFNSASSLKLQGLPTSMIDEALNRKIDSIHEISEYDLHRVRDIDVVRSEFLIENIDFAFQNWNKRPWAKKYTFAQFCEYVLPYRIQDEPLMFWRKEIYEQYKWLEDSLQHISDVKRACEYVNNAIMSEYSFIWSLDRLPLLNLYELSKYKAGVCKHRYPWVVSIMRTFGLPVAIDYGPQWTKHPGDHAITSLITPDGKALSFNAGDPTKFADKNTLPFPKHYNPFVKIYRKMFSIQKESLPFLGEPENNIPEVFQDSTIKDVTDQYFYSQQNLVIGNLPPNENNVVFLYTPKISKRFIPISWSLIKNNTATFKNLATEAVYMLMFYHKDKLTLVNNPFIFHKDGSLEYLNPRASTQSVRLMRKFPPNDLIKEYMYGMIGATIQGSNTMDFGNYKVIHTIQDTAKGYEKVHLKSSENFRYVRYVSSDTGRISLAELSFFTKDTIKLTGRHFSSISSKEKLNLKITSKSDVLPDYAFDNDISTNFMAPAHSWVGLDLGRSKEIRLIGYLYRNDFNVIEIGHLYELFYFNMGWHSLGPKKANANEIVYKNVPENALLLLQDLSKGQDERVFLYRNGKQDWW